MNEYTSNRLANEILGGNLQRGWPRLRKLILIAEDFDFTSEESTLLAPRLLELAIQYRDSNDQQDAPAVWSAIRTGASMLRPNKASRLLALLKPGHPIETSLVALKMLGRIFEAQRPEKLDQHTDLANEVRGIAESLLEQVRLVEGTFYIIAGRASRNAVVVDSSQNAAMTQLAAYALATMASNDTLQIVRAVRHIGASWFTQQTARELRELQRSWESRSSPIAPEVLGLLECAMNELQG